MCSRSLHLTEPARGVETNDNDRMLSPLLHDCRAHDEVDDNSVHIVVAVVLLRLLLNLGHFLLQWCHNTNSDCRMDIVVAAAAENNYHILVVCSSLDVDRRVVGNYGNDIVLRRSWYDDQLQ